MYDNSDFFLPRASQGDFVDTASFLTNAYNIVNDKTGELLGTRGSLNNLDVRITLAGLSVRGSLCKYYLPDNTYTLTRKTTREAIQKLSDNLHQNLDEARLTRIDVSTNFIMEKPARTYYPLLGLSTYFVRSYCGKGTLYYNNRSNDMKRVMTFYDKLPEVEARDGITPDVFVGENLLRYESRWIGRLSRQLCVPEVKGKTLYDEKFYHYIIELWANNYFSIEKVKNQNNEVMKDIKDVKSATNYILSVALNRLPPDVLQNIIEEFKSRQIFSDAKYYTRLRQKLKEILSNKDTANESDQIKELDSEIRQVLAYKE
jgi:hypothetical protein